MAPNGPSIGAEAGQSKYVLIGLFVLLLLIGIAHPNLTGDLVLPFSLVVPKSLMVWYRLGLLGGLFAATVILRRSLRFRRYWPVACSFTIFSFALFFDWYTTIIFGGFPNTAVGNAEAIVLSTGKVVVPVVLLARLAGFRFSTLFLQRGNLKSGLAVGLAGFFFFLALLFATGNVLFGGYGNLQTATSLLPLALVFSLSNGLREELLYRGLFLNQYGPLFGRLPSNLLQCLIFTWGHSPVTYSTDIVIFLAILAPLSFALGYVMQRTGALWGSILIHAGADVSIALGMFSSLS